MTQSNNTSNLAPLYRIFIYIYIRNPFNLFLNLLKRLISGILTFIIPISFTYTLSPILLVSILLITSLSLFIVTNYNLLLPSSSILVSSTEVNAPSVVIGTILGGILSTIYYNYSSNCVIKPCRKYYNGLINRLGIQIDIINKIKNRVFARGVLPNRLTPIIF